ncbi:FUSC family protein [Streptomyces sp. NPDC006632]|uniref:FUSC family protein n=1 Tax=Streptomyces sp. NPDC006632 TaxID=3157182 RepID=UPI0033BF6DBF
MVKRVFVAPDPGRLRLRSASRAVLGIGLAVVACGLAGHSLVAAITGGLAALLALFTVTDPTVRGQAVTTALLPVAGLPVFALAACLHDVPLARDLAFLAIVGAGVYARRWGPRGHSLGVFGFMSFFVAQFLHMVPSQLPELYEAVLLSLAIAAAVRFGAWCYERGGPVTAALVAPAPGRGLYRATTRQAVQAVVGAGFALAVGQLLSPDRWYWAVGATWWIFVNTTSRGETLVRGFRRVLGTVIGAGAGLAVAVPLHGAPVPTAVLIALCVFGIFYTAAVSYTWMMLSVTLMASLLYGLLGVLDTDLLALRFFETGVGMAGSVIAVLIVLPITTHATTDAWVRHALHSVRASAAAAAARLAGDDADPLPHIAQLELTLGRVRLSLAPLVHPLNPVRARKARARQILGYLDDCAREARGLAAVAADAEASHDQRLTAACERVEAAVAVLVSSPSAPSASPRSSSPVHKPAAAAAEHPALAHLHELERVLLSLGSPLQAAPGSPLADT